jgi:aminoglycoside phosphotransferase family enzyme
VREARARSGAGAGAPPGAGAGAPPASDEQRAEDLEREVAFLRRPESYGDAAGTVEAIETHLSWVFLTRDRVYKLKKPVRVELRDFSTVELRRRNCLRETRLNRRLAPDVYLGTVALTADAGGALRLGRPGPGRTVVDWLVEMRRLPSDSMLDRRIAARTVSAADVRRVGSMLARFYQSLPPVRLTAAARRRRFRAEIDQARRELAAPAAGLPATPVLAIHDALHQLLERYRDLLDERVRERRIVEAHGDLRPEHVCLTDPPVIIDCLEFERALRLLDPADELAYLALECERLGAPWIREELLGAYRQITGDSPDPALITFYTVFRAYVRARIAILHLREPGDHERWRTTTQRYLELAAAKLEAAAREGS